MGNPPSNKCNVNHNHRFISHDLKPNHEGNERHKMRRKYCRWFIFLTTSHGKSGLTRSANSLYLQSTPSHNQRLIFGTM